MSRHLGLDLAAVTNLDGSIDDDPVVIRDRSELVAFNDDHPLPPNAIQGDEATWNAFLELPRETGKNSTAPTPSTRERGGGGDG
ncbi:MAG: hypothetical protein MK085_05655, partial [Phycisphaerales bacterium]|nr:hypothetical protein [Phycisphaerales bacterium]